MSTGVVRKGAEADVYRLRADIDPAETLHPYQHNTARSVIEEWRAGGLLNADQIAQWERSLEKERDDIFKIRTWAPRFIDAHDRGNPLPLLTPSKKVTHVLWGDFGAMTSRECALQALLDHRDTGITVTELRIYTGIDGAGPGGGLSMLDLAGVLARIEGERRRPLSSIKPIRKVA